MPARVLLITSDAAGASSVLPKEHGLDDLVVASPQRALGIIGEQRARGLPVVAVVDMTTPRVQPLLTDCLARYPEVPLILATPAAQVPPLAPSAAVRRTAGSQALLEAIGAASRTAVQQARVRTSLDRFNVRLAGSRAAPVDARQHRRLLLSGLYLSSILEQASDAVFVVDRAGVVMLWNRAAELLFGVSAARMTGQRIDAVGPDRGGDALLAAATTLSGDAGATHLHLSIRGDNRPQFVQVSLSVIRDEDGVAIAISGIARDVTEREALLRSVQEQADALAASNRHKEEFLAVLSHELRTPLNTVLGWARMLQTMPHEPDQVRKAADSILRNAQVQHRLVTDLLDFARIAAGKLTLEVSPRSLTKIVRQSVEALRPEFQVQDVTIAEEYAGEISVPVDADRVRQVISNLLSNALKFTPPGGRVAIAVEPTPDCALLTVSDSGRGIAPAFLPHVFDPFRQADESTSGSHGLGLGLAISHRIVTLHGGTMQADSAGEGMGATFTVCFPRVVAPTFEEEHPA